MALRETRFNVYGEELTTGDLVWTRTLTWGAVSGTLIRDEYGVYSGYQGSPVQLRLRHAARRYRCQGDCGNYT